VLPQNAGLGARAPDVVREAPAHTDALSALLANSSSADRSDAGIDAWMMRAASSTAHDPFGRVARESLEELRVVVNVLDAPFQYCHVLPRHGITRSSLRVACATRSGHGCDSAGQCRLLLTTRAGFSGERRAAMAATSDV